MRSRTTFPTLGMILLVLAAAAGPCIAEEAPMEVDVVGKRAPDVAPLRTAERLEVGPMAVLPSALEIETDRVHRMLESNRQARRIQQGFSRELGQSHRVVLSADMLSKSLPAEAQHGLIDVRPDGSLVFMLRADVPGAYAVRLHLSQVDLPKQSRLWVYGPGQPAVPFTLAMLRSAGDLWCPAVHATEIWLEVEIPGNVIDPARKYGFVLDSLAEIFPPELIRADQGALDAKSAPDFSCLRDAACEDLSSYAAALDSYELAVAHLSFMESGGLYICSGALVNDVGVDGYLPYLLTANHCFSTQDAAATLDAYFDYRTPACGDPAPSVWLFPRVDGATLLESSETSDFTLVRLSTSPPSPRAYLGWSTASLVDNQPMYRLSHPDGRPQAFSRAVYKSFGTYTCSSAPRPSFLYSEHDYGSTWGGSSGAPVVNANGQILGQLLGKCGPDDFGDCDNDIAVLDGAFATTYLTGDVASYLYPNATQECIDTISMGGSLSGTLQASCDAEHRAGSYAHYYTFTVSSTTEVQIDLQSSAFDTYLFLLSGSGTQGTVVESNDDVGGTNRNSRISKTLAAGTYTIEATSYASGVTGPFSISLSAPVVPCSPGATTLCMNNDRFKVTATYRTQQGSSGSGRAVELTGDTGYFWFFDQSNVEVVVKVLSGCGVNQHYWVFGAGLTNVEVNLEVVDTQTGASWSRQSPLGTAFQPIQDTAAFSSCP